MPHTPKSPTNFDKHIGTRIRTRRLGLSYSQTDLADHLGLSFQQVQKYENGTNRVSGGRLEQIATFLKTDRDFFYPDKPHNGSAPPEVSLMDDFISTKDGIMIARAFVRIKSPEVRHVIAQSIAKISEAMEPEVPRFDLAAQVRTLGADSLLPPKVRR
jgi:transcriptional regulator with XRE-family HTH domain